MRSYRWSIFWHGGRHYDLFDLFRVNGENGLVAPKGSPDATSPPRESCLNSAQGELRDDLGTYSSS